MGIFKSFKNLFSNDITPTENSLSGLVCPYALKHSKIKINSKVKVPRGYVFVIGHNGKALDHFGEGEYYLSPATLPLCCKRLKIHRTDKNNNIKKSFKAEAYFVNINDYELYFKTQEKAELGRRATGIFKVGLSATLKFKVVDAKKFMDALLNEYSYLKQGEAERIVVSYMSDFVVAILNKYNFALSEFIYSNPIIEENLVGELSQKLSKLGIMLLQIDDIKYILPKKYQKEYENNIKIKEQDKKEDADDNIEKNTTSKDQEYVPFGNIVIEEISKDDISINSSNQIEEFDEKQENEAKEQEFVDLNLDNLYKQDKKGKECKLCGYINTENATICEICKNKLD